MFGNGKKKGLVEFSVKPAAGATGVGLAGDFNGWEPAAMKKQKDGRFALSVKLPPGSYEYRFVVDDHWTTDPDHSHWAPNPYGSFNSVAKVG